MLRESDTALSAFAPVLIKKNRSVKTSGTQTRSHRHETKAATHDDGQRAAQRARAETRVVEAPVANGGERRSDHALAVHVSPAVALGPQALQLGLEELRVTELQHGPPQVFLQLGRTLTPPEQAVCRTGRKEQRNQSGKTRCNDRLQQADA